MRVLVTETDPRVADEAIGVLERAGHHIVRCSERNQPAFPCRGVAGGGCPLDEGVDAAVAVRGPHPEATRSEAGITCALREYVPVVVVGDPDHDPFAPWRATTATLDDLPERLEDALHTDLPRHRDRVTAELRRHLPVSAIGAHADVHRDRRRVVVTLHLPPELDDAAAEALAVRAAGTVREIDRWAGVVDVAIERDTDPRDEVPS